METCSRSYMVAVAVGEKHGDSRGRRGTDVVIDRCARQPAAGRPWRKLLGPSYHFFFLATYILFLSSCRALHCIAHTLVCTIPRSPTMAMAPRLLTIISILFAAGVASAVRDLADPARFPPAYGYSGIPPGFFGPGNPGGAGYGGPGGGYARGGVEVPTVVCSDKGPCYGKKVACPKKCFWSYSRSGNGYGAGGGGGSCSIDCKTKCTATC
ncbi:hypothetical protein E2562_028987 [Oryza meyeriana var. granulata]|uniref:Uncharacterized protein n=1 Tax=Oryza meyeriana var. granulata TaxID=110450 RepID=A0A6G1DQ43_9ORYZ|nr:hypothetical protein E2562_028987 [Oryza meyeriana var. granulata]